MGRTLSRMTAPGALAQVRHVTPVRPRAARGLVAEVYAGLERDFGMLAPPVILHSPVPPVMAACWLMLAESLLASGTVTRAAKEAVAAEVSAANTCPYCVDVHTATLHALTPSTPPALTTWARTTSTARTASIPPALTTSAAPGESAPPALTSSARTASIPPPGDTVGAELVGVVVTFQYINRMVNVFLGESPLPPNVPRAAHGPAMRLFGRAMRPAARRPVTPGGSLGLLPAAPLPADLGWAAAVPNLGGAFGRAAAVIEEHGRRSVPGEVRELVADRVAAWDGEAPGPGRHWVEEAVAGLSAGHRRAGRLALLTALASYQVDAGVVADFRRAVPDERALVEVTAWASLTAARRVGAWCAAPVRNVSIAE